MATCYIYLFLHNKWIQDLIPYQKKKKKATFCYKCHGSVCGLHLLSAPPLVLASLKWLQECSRSSGTGLAQVTSLVCLGVGADGWLSLSLCVILTPGVCPDLLYGGLRVPGALSRSWWKEMVPLQWQQTEAIYSEFTMAREPATIIVSGRPLGDGRKWESCRVEKRKVTRYVLTVGCWLREPGHGVVLTRREASCVIGVENRVGFLCLIMGWKLEHEDSKSDSHFLSPSLSGPMAAEVVVGFLDQLWLGFFCYLWSVMGHVCIQSLNIQGSWVQSWKRHNVTSLVFIGKSKSAGQLGSRDKKEIEYFSVEGGFHLIAKSCRDWRTKHAPN